MWLRAWSQTNDFWHMTDGSIIKMHCTFFKSNGTLFFGSIVVRNQFCLIGKEFMMLWCTILMLMVLFIRTVQEQDIVFIFILFFMGLSILAGENLLYSVDLKYLSGVLSTYLPTMGDHESREIFQLGKQRQRCDAAYLS